MEEQVDRQRAKEFAGKLLGIYTGSVLTKLIGGGHETGLFEAAAGGPGTSQQIAERAGLNAEIVFVIDLSAFLGQVIVYPPDLLGIRRAPPALLRPHALWRCIRGPGLPRMPHEPPSFLPVTTRILAYHRHPSLTRFAIANVRPQ